MRCPRRDPRPRRIRTAIRRPRLTNIFPRPKLRATGPMRSRRRRMPRRRLPIFRRGTRTPILRIPRCPRQARPPDRCSAGAAPPARPRPPTAARRPRQRRRRPRRPRPRSIRPMFCRPFSPPPSPRLRRTMRTRGTSPFFRACPGRRRRPRFSRARICPIRRPPRRLPRPPWPRSTLRRRPWPVAPPRCCRGLHLRRVYPIGWARRPLLPRRHPFRHRPLPQPPRRKARELFSASGFCPQGPPRPGQKLPRRQRRLFPWLPKPWLRAKKNR